MCEAVGHTQTDYKNGWSRSCLFAVNKAFDCLFTYYLIAKATVI